MWLDVAVSAPAHSQVGGLLTYCTDLPAQVGQLVRVPFGKREVLGVVWRVHSQAPSHVAQSAVKHVTAVLDGVSPLSPHWLQLVQFTAQYYQRAIGEVALAALPPQLRDLTPVQLARRLTKHSASEDSLKSALASPWPLSAQQAQVLAQMAEAAGPFLIHGATGSGKTEVYLQAVARCLAASSDNALLARPIFAAQVAAPLRTSALGCINNSSRVPS